MIQVDHFAKAEHWLALASDALDKGEVAFQLGSSASLLLKAAGVHALLAQVQARTPEVEDEHGFAPGDFASSQLAALDHAVTMLRANAIWTRQELGLVADAVAQVAVDLRAVFASLGVVDPLPDSELSGAPDGA